jgi:small multidrug resistance family-3 protein
MKSLLWYCLAALGEIAGCFAFWAWLRLGKHPLWTLAGVASLVIFALALTRIDALAAGHAYAAYGGIYQTRPDRWDVIAAGICFDARAGQKPAGGRLRTGGPPHKIQLLETLPSYFVDTLAFRPGRSNRLKRE